MKLSESNSRILDIAFEAGFESQESFTRAFKKAFGVTPAYYRRRRSELPFLRKLRFDEDYLRHIHRGVSLEPVFSARPSRVFVGMRTHFYGVDSEKNNLTIKLPSLWAAFVPRLDEIRRLHRGVAYGVIRQTAAQGGELEYLAAVEVADRDRVPAGMTAIELPAARYATFTHTGDLSRLDATVSYIYSSWLARSGMRHTYGADLEVYDGRNRPGSEESAVEYAIPVVGGAARIATDDGEVGVAPLNLVGGSHEGGNSMAAGEAEVDELGTGLAIRAQDESYHARETG